MQTELYQDVRAEIYPLEQAHFAEVEQRPIAEGCRHEAAYQGMIAAGMLHLTTARFRGVLVGYCLAVVAPSCHSFPDLVGTLDSFYLMPEARRGWNGVRLLRHAEAALRERGCRWIVGGYKASAHNLSRLFDHLGWRPSEVYYRKDLSSA